MESTPVIPKSNITTLVSLGIALPSEPYLQVVVLVHQAKQIIQDELALIDGYTKNALGEVTVDIYACGIRSIDLLTLKEATGILPFHPVTGLVRMTGWTVVREVSLFWGDPRLRRRLSPRWAA
jgi:hypothetical protein